MTVGTIIKKEVNNLYKDSEKTGGEKPIDLIRATRPIVIVDEPQSVGGGLAGRGKEALNAMNPLCTLRDSATHVKRLPILTRLVPSFLPGSLFLFGKCLWGQHIRTPDAEHGLRTGIRAVRGGYRAGRKVVRETAV